MTTGAGSGSPQAVDHEADEVEEDGRAAGRRHLHDVDLLGHAPGEGTQIRLGSVLRLQSAVAGQAGIFPAHEVQDAGEQDRDQAAEHHRRQDLRDQSARALVEDLPVAGRKRERALSDAARHDRDDNIEEGMLHAQPEGGTHERAHDRRQDRAGRHGHEDLEEPLDQDPPIHAQDAADDDGRDEQIEELRGIGEIGHRLHDFGRQPVLGHEERGDEGGEDRRRAQMAQHRHVLAEFAAGEAEQAHDADHHADLRRELARHGVIGDHRREHDVHRQGDDADAQLHDLPPAVRPEALGRS
jgi:hypothetical protein